LEQYQNLIEKYHTVGTVPKSNRKTKNTTLLEQYQNLIEKYHTVGTVPKSNRKTKNTTLFDTVPTVWYFSIRFWYCSNSVVYFVFLLDFGTVPTVWYFFVFIEKYHTVRTVPKSNRKTKNTTLLEQYQNLIEKPKIPHCWNSTKI
jgi:predicted LPLAT superfamily acyltransferase